MAIFDWLNSDIGGTTQPIPDTSNQGFEAGFSTGAPAKGRTGIKWGDLISAAAQTKSNKYPSLIGTPQQVSAQQAGLLPLMQPNQNQQSSMQYIIPMLMKMFGIGA